MQGEHDRRSVGPDDAEVSPVRCIAGQWHHPGAGAIEASRPQVAIDPIADPNVVLFHAGTVKRGGKLLNNAGRVISVCAHAPTLSDAPGRWPGYLPTPRSESPASRLDSSRTFCRISCKEAKPGSTLRFMPLLSSRRI